MTEEVKFDKKLLEPCPVLYPSAEEFQDPVRFLSRGDIAKLGEEYGIVKVVPPSFWKPQFLLSPTFKFHTRLQRLSDLGLTTRSRKFFTENINRFLKMRRKRSLRLYFNVGADDLSESTSGDEEKKVKIYYYDLYVLVDKYGGFNKISPEMWSHDINHHFGVKRDSELLKQVYEANIKDYAEFLTQSQNSFNFPESDSEDELDSCLVCGKHNRPTRTLLCDNCDNPYHLDCLVPPLAEIPSGSWYCDKCLIGTGEYGFEEQVDLKYSLPEFYHLCKEFEAKFITDYNQGLPLDVDTIERKFWEFVEVEKSDLEVKYGADIHNLRPGEISGFPMANSTNLDPSDPVTKFFIEHPWNLNRLPFAKGSLLNFINTSISGMTVPWIYIGSLLSTFCWHVEDHYTLSANYCHFGATKKWYGIPSKDADKFEKLMKDSAPDLFQRQPDLLHQLVTLLSPAKLVKNGIKCVYADQNPNEFVITYPRVYHAGFNCGFNFNEAVNFTMNLWLPFGEKAIHDYKVIKKENVFSHYQLVENILTRFLTSDKIVIEDWKLAGSGLAIFEHFIQQQKDNLDQIDQSKFSIKTVPKHYKERDFAKEQTGVFEDDEDEDLCDACRTHLCYQYCVIDNRKHKFYNKVPPIAPAPASDPAPASNPTVKSEMTELTSQSTVHSRIPIHQLLTPESSPQEMAQKKSLSSGDDESSPPESVSSIFLQSLNTQSKPKPQTEVDKFEDIISAAKSQSISPDPPTKRRKSTRVVKSKYSNPEKPVNPGKPTKLEPAKHEPSAVNGKMTSVQHRSSLEILNDYDVIRLCLPCLVRACLFNSNYVPAGSSLIIETPIPQMSSLAEKVRLRATFPNTRQPLNLHHIN